MNDEFTGFQIGGPWVRTGCSWRAALTRKSYPPTTLSPAEELPHACRSQRTRCLLSQRRWRAGCKCFEQIRSFWCFGRQSISNQCHHRRGYGVSPSEFGNVTRTLTTPDHIYDFYARTDLQLGSDTIVSRCIYNRNTFFNLDSPVGEQPTPNAAGYPINEPALSQAILFSWTHNLSSSMVNELRGAFGRENVEFGGNNIGNTVPGQNQLDQALTNITFQNPNANLGFGPGTIFPPRENREHLAGTGQLELCKG